jgi:hypothetical protein
MTPSGIGGYCYYNHGVHRPWPPLSLSQSHSLAFMAHKTALRVRANRSATTTYSKMVIAP